MFKSIRRRVILFAAITALSFSPTVTFAGSVSAAKSRVSQAKSNLDDGRTDQAEDALNQADKFLDGLSDDEKAPIQKEIKELRTKLETVTKARESERVEKNVNRILDYADQESVPGSAQRMIES